MESLFLKNYRCFSEPTPARLAPITVLVGENSSGKSSFLSAIRSVWDVAFRQVTPDFNEEPFMLGDFTQVVNFRGGRAGRAESFELGFTLAPGKGLPLVIQEDATGIVYRVEFRKGGAVPRVSRRSITIGAYGIEDEYDEEGVTYRVTYKTPSAQWKLKERDLPKESLRAVEGRLPRLNWSMMRLHESKSAHGQLALFDRETGTRQLRSMSLDNPDLTHELRTLERILWNFDRVSRARPFAFAPIRTKPERTYNPVSDSPRPEGSHVPVRLARTYRQDKRQWERLKSAIDAFGRASGLFDGIEIRSLGKHESDPFQVRIKIAGPPMNLIDVGYGVSQVLPILVDVIQDSGPGIYLLQQPEVHLHPKAQAELATFFSVVAANGQKQFIIETHSDFLLDRLRHEISSNNTISPEDVSIIYFERDGLDVNLHNISIDRQGNILGQPPGYRQFFLDEERRILGV